MTRIEQIRERLAKATPGPWTNTLGSGYHLMTWVVSWPKDRQHPIFIADCLPDKALDRAEKDHVPNMELITHAPADLAYLLSRLAAAEGVVKALGEQTHDCPRGIGLECQICAALARWEQGT